MVVGQANDKDSLEHSYQKKVQITTLWLEQIQYACKFPAQPSQLNENPIVNQVLHNT